MRSHLLALVIVLKCISICTATSVDDAGSQALVLMQLGEMRSAVSVLANSNMVNDVSWRTAAAIACLSAGEFKGAYELAISALERYQDETLMLAAALSAIGCGDCEAAVQLLTQLVASQPKRHQVLPKLLLNLLGISTDIGDGLEACEEAAIFLNSFLLIQNAKFASAKENLQRLKEKIESRAKTHGSNAGAIVRFSLAIAENKRQLLMLTPHADVLPRDEIQRILTAAIGSKEPVYRTASIHRPPPVISSLTGERRSNGMRLVSGKVRISVDASALADASYVTFYVDCQPRHSTNRPPFVWEWDTSAETPGTHTLTIIVFRSDGSACAASSQKVFVTAPPANMHCLRRTSPNNAAVAPVIRRAMGTAISSAEQAHNESKPKSNECDAQSSLRVPFMRLIDVDPNAVECMLGFAYAASGDYHEAFHTLGKLYWRTRDEALLGQLLKLRQITIPRPASAPSLISSLQNRRRAVALTFDDGPRPPYTNRILELLSRYNSKATFFVVGEMVQLYPDLLRAVVNAGHEVGNHSYTHTPSRFLTKTEIDRELLLTDIAIAEACGVHPVFFRPPGGGTTDQLISALSGQHYLCALWNINIGSYRGTPQEIASQMLSAVRSGSIILMHNGMDMSVDVLPYLLEGLRALGYEVTSLGELLGMSNIRCNDLKAAR
ncbi:MAG: polysaccharide deacetylase family protein [Armatimonadetes bacterium]|nr:polysaccharide deacetylase family protein [Armatimonadota bacterium]